MTRGNDEIPDKWDTTRMPSVAGQVAIVTGANSGIGYEAALELARKGAHVVLACRNEERGRDAVVRIQEALKETQDGGTVEFMQVDVGDFESVKRFTTEHLGIPYTETEDGFEAMLKTNHLGPFTLTAHLFDLLKVSAPSRIVNVSSLAHRTAYSFNEDKIQITKDKYEPWLAYSNTKLANLYFTLELARRFEANNITGVTAIACHPGFATTNLSIPAIESQSRLYQAVYRVRTSLPMFQSAAMGALPTLYAATEAKSGQLIGPRGFKTWWGYPTVETPAKCANSLSAAKKLWEWSESVANTPFPIEK
ncbi:hypothetical protein Poli38472_006832 [Pythium oligandrum]|uniref:Uncharacterized protein n=1 Tax=Pythium oligandrum TaxID=41045 RepID=A0A8K1FEN1_PYTOL|nr:hypothetical protein Poli38472_006832 [Pythium oligandrum]|eukprot:TMW56822.1 hypothetical protein Poli38472_006832 [Pythium oligandrum]